MTNDSMCGGTMVSTKEGKRFCVPEMNVLLVRNVRINPRAKDLVNMMAEAAAPLYTWSLRRLPVDTSLEAGSRVVRGACFSRVVLQPLVGPRFCGHILRPRSRCWACMPRDCADRPARARVHERLHILLPGFRSRCPLLLRTPVSVLFAVQLGAAVCYLERWMLLPTARS
ncbi:hypothetical protein NFI96_004136 [Prochilodus magdalenae]|nr:hypothetical protein NFI96_004136 [Prochilodus magdalenae]